MKIGCAALLTMACSMGSVPAAAGVQLGAGVVDEIDGQGSWLATVAWLTEGEHPWELIAGNIGERDTASLRTPEVLWISASKRFTWNRWFAQSGIAYADVDNDVLSNHFQFQTGIGYDFGTLSLSLRHLSNANTGGRNRGETFLLLDYAL